MRSSRRLRTRSQQLAAGGLVLLAFVVGDSLRSPVPSPPREVQAFLAEPDDPDVRGAGDAGAAATSVPLTDPQAEPVAAESATAVPATAVPTAVPPTAVPATAVPATAVPTAVPPTPVPATAVPPTPVLPPPQPAAPAQSCTPGYSVCIEPGPDVDCSSGSGNGPRYVQGPLQVTGSDPYGLDHDNDGIGCKNG